MRRYLLSLAATLAAACTAAAQPSYGKAPIPGEIGPDAPARAAFDQKLGAKVPLDLTFSDHTGREAPLGEFTGGKPSILVLHYNHCPKLCNEVIVGLLASLNEVRRGNNDLTAGQGFNVVFVSIDPREAPAAALKNRDLFLREYDGRDPAAPGVAFLTASQGQGTDIEAADRKIHQLADAVGFNYELRWRNQEFLYHADTGKWVTVDGSKELPRELRAYDYGHSPGVTFLTADGTVSKYLFGLNYAPRDVRFALLDASGGKVGTLVDRVRQLCFAYDERDGHYKYRSMMRLTAWLFAPVMLGVVWLAYTAWRQARREKPLEPPGFGQPPEPSVN